MAAVTALAADGSVDMLCAGCLKPHPDATPDPKPKTGKQGNPPELLRSDALHIWPYNSGVVIASPVASSMAGEDDGGLDAAVILPLRCVDTQSSFVASYQTVQAYLRSLV